VAISDKTTSRDCKHGNPFRTSNKSPTEFCSNGFPRRFKYDRDGNSTGEKAWKKKKKERIRRRRKRKKRETERDRQ
jgi:hypothetical protein